MPVTLPVWTDGGLHGIGAPWYKTYLSLFDYQCGAGTKGPHCPPPGNARHGLGRPPAHGLGKSPRDLFQPRSGSNRDALHHAVHLLHLHCDGVDAWLRLPVAVIEDDGEEQDGDRRDDADRDPRDPARVMHAHPVDRDEERDKPEPQRVRGHRVMEQLYCGYLPPEEEPRGNAEDDRQFLYAASR